MWANAHGYGALNRGRGDAVLVAHILAAGVVTATRQVREMLNCPNAKPRQDATHRLERPAALIADDCFPESARTDKPERGNGVSAQPAVDGSRRARGRHCYDGPDFLMADSGFCLRPLGLGDMTQ